MANLTFGQLEQLWISAGGPSAWAPTMAGVALAESDGDPAATNPSGATGLWQIEWPLHEGVTPGATSQAALEDPATNAAAAVAILGGGPGITAWEGDPVGQLAQNGVPLSLQAAEQATQAAGHSTADAVDPTGLAGQAAGTVENEAVDVVEGPISLIPGVGGAGNFVSDADATLKALSSTAFWERVGMGALGVGLVVAGLAVFFGSTGKGQKTISDAAVAGLAA